MNKQISTTDLQTGALVMIPLNRLKKSPRNVRKVPHTQDAIDALAASIAVKGVLQNLVVEPERDADGLETGAYLVTIGEGRRLAQRLRVKRKEIRRDALIPCVIDTINDAEEISLDENVTREAMHPADQFEAFKLLSDKGYGAEDIAARFGVTAQIVRQRLRLGAVSPVLMRLYRDNVLKLEHLMAFALTENQQRQEAVYERLKDGYNIQSYAIRRLLTENQVDADDFRAVFVGVAAYEAAGGHIERDLFTDDNGGYFTDVDLLDRLALEKLEATASEIQAREGWNWAKAYLEYPYNHGMRRVYPDAVDLSEDDQKIYEAACRDVDELASTFNYVENMPEEVRTRYESLNQQIVALDEKSKVYEAEDLQRGGVMVLIDSDGALRIERGFIRVEDEAPEPKTGTDEPETDTETDRGEETAHDAETDDEEEQTQEVSAIRKPLPDSLIADLTAHRTLGLQLALSDRPDLAMITATHALASDIFYRHNNANCVDLRLTQQRLAGFATGIEDTAAAIALRTRHDTWAERLPNDAADLWEYLAKLDTDSLYLLFAYCVSLGLNAVYQPFMLKAERLNTVDKLATVLSLDMAEHWQPTTANFFGRITKAHIFDAVTDAVGIEAAHRMDGLKKPAMAEHAESLLSGANWLPEVLRTKPAPVEEVSDNDAEHFQAAAE